MGQHIEVLLGGVEDGDDIGLEEWPERRDVDCERIDEHQLAGPGELHQCERREIRAFSMELGVDGVPRLFEQLGDDRVDIALFVDPSVRMSMRHAGPDATSRPEAIQACVPPATLATSAPRSARNRQACMLRPPDRQMT